MYQLTWAETEELDRYLKKNLAKDFIRTNRSDVASPVMFTRKSKGILRFCMDYKSLNAVTKKNWYPLSLIMETLNRLSWAKIFTKLDIIAAFN